MGTVETIEIGGKDMEVQIWSDEKGIHMKELGLSTNEESTALLNTYIKNNPYWHDEYTEDKNAFFEKLAAYKELQSILEDEEKTIDLSKVEKQGG